MPQTTVLEFEDAVSAGECRGAVGDHEDGEVAVEDLDGLEQGIEDAGFVVGIEGVGGFVQDKERRLAKERAGDGEALALAAGEQDAAVAGDGVESAGEVVDEGGGGEVQGALEVFGGGVGAGPEEVFADGLVKEDGFLANVADTGSPAAEGGGIERLAIEEDAAAGGGEEAGDEVGYGAFAGA